MSRRVGASSSVSRHNQPPTPDRSVTPHTNLLERLCLQKCASIELGRVTEYNVLVSGIITSLKKHQDCASAEDLCYVEYQDREMPKRKKQCQEIINVLKDINCPIQLQPHHFLYLDYEALTPMFLWVLRKCVLLECKTIPYKQTYTDFFAEEIKSIEESKTEFQQAYKGARCLGDSRAAFKNIFGKQLSGVQILGEYLITDFLITDDSEMSDDENLPEDLKDFTAEILLGQDNKRPVLKQYRDMLGKWIEELIIDDEIQALERRIENEATSFIMARMQLQFIESQVLDIETRMQKKYDVSLIPKLLKHQDSLLNRVRFFETTMITDRDASSRMATRLQQLLHLLQQKEDRNKEEEECVRLNFVTYIEARRELESIIEKGRELVVKMTASVTDCEGLEKRKARVDETCNLPQIVSEQQFSTIDDKISDKIIELSYKVTCVMNETRICVPAEYRRALLYQKFFFEYIGDIRFKLADVFWKAEVLHHYRVEDKKRLEDLKNRFGEKQRQEIKDALETNTIFRVNNTVAEVENAIAEIKNRANASREEVLRMQITLDMAVG